MIKAFHIIVLLAVVVGSCKSQQQVSQQQVPDGHNSQNSVDWSGVYRGVLPCADCEGIAIELELNTDHSYKLAYQYQGSDMDVIREEGKFEWDDSGSKITLNGEKAMVRRLQVGENQLFSLDGDGNRITGELAEMFILKKKGFDQKITEKYWKLLSLNGKPIEMKDTQTREAHFILKENSNTVNGNTGCNGMRGSYSLDSMDKIEFSQMLSTRMACMDVPYEGEFLKVFEQADNYSISGDNLVLKSADKELASFVAVWFH